MIQLQGTKDRVKSIVAGMMEEIQQQLSHELDGVARNVMHAAME